MANQMFLNKENVNNQFWQFNFDERKSSVTLNTANKYLDKDIKIVPKLGSVIVGTNLNDEEYAELTDRIVPTSGYLYIKGGFHKPVKISLATLVPDAATITGTLIDGSYCSGTMMAGTTAYDKDGKLIVGTLSTIEVPSTYYTTSATGAVAASKLEAGNLANAQYIKQGSVTIDGGGSQVISNYKNKPVISASAESDTTNLTINTETSKLTSPTNKYTFTVNAGSGALSGTTQVVTSAVVVKDDTFTAGWVEKSNISLPSVAQDVQTLNPTVTVEANNTEKYYSIDKASFTTTGAKVSITGLDSTAIKPTATMQLGTGTGTSTMASGVATLESSKTTDTDKVYIEIDASTNAVTSAKTVGVQTDVAGKINVTQGYVGADIAGDKAVTVTNASGTKTISLTAADTLKRYLTINKVTPTVSGGGVTKTGGGSASITPSKTTNLASNITLLTTAPTGEYWTLKSQASNVNYKRSDIFATNGAGYIDANDGTSAVLSETTGSLAVSSKDYYLTKTTYKKGLSTTSTTGNILTTGGQTTSVSNKYEVSVNAAGYDYANDTVATIDVYTGSFTVSTD